MKLKAYDNYRKQYITIEISNDELWDWKSSGPSGVTIGVNLSFKAIEGDADNCDPKRWSDLEQFEIIN